MAKQEKSAELNITRMDFGVMRFRILGRTPLIHNRMSQKVMHELLLPKGKKTAADKAANLKHDPMREFVDSPYLDQDPKGPTYLQHLASAFKGGIMGAALDVPGTNKTQIGRLVWVNGERLPVWGVPKMLMSVTRSADMNRTPDVRTRAIQPEWAAEIEVSFAVPILNATGIGNLVASAGLFQGLGDWRTGKGKGTYGQFVVPSTPAEEAEWHRIVKLGGRKAQIAAMEEPDFYDEETEDLYRWYVGEVAKRGRMPDRPEPTKARRTKRVPVEANGSAD